MAEGDSCRRAAQAAIEVVREECEGMDVEIREMDNGTFLEVPSEAVDMMEDAEGSPISMMDFEQVVDQSNFVRDWMSGMAENEDVSITADSREYAATVYSLAESVFDEPLDFEVDDLVGSPALSMISRE